MPEQELKKIFSENYTLTWTVETTTTGVANSYLATANVITSAAGSTYTCPVTVNPGGGGQWSNVISTRALSQWQIQAIRRLNEVAGLPENWDSYGSIPPTKAAVEKAMAILRESDIEYFLAPRVVPVSGGGLQLEWDTDTRGLELEVLDDGSVEYLKTERREPREEGNVQTVSEIRSLFLWLLSGSLPIAA